MSNEVKVWKKDEIKELLETSDKLAIRGLLRIFQLQTADEQESEYTKHINGVGFTGVDGEILSSMAKFFKSRNYLSPKQMEIVRKRMPKYAGQLTKVANGEIVLEDI